MVCGEMPLCRAGEGATNRDKSENLPLNKSFAACGERVMGIIIFLLPVLLPGLSVKNDDKKMTGSPLKLFFSLHIFLITLLQAGAQYIEEVIEYRPAPGQYINTAGAGSPYASQSLEGGVDGMLNLGAFGGYVIFRFENPVENHPDNPYGIDFTIFGNPLIDWSEPATVSVMKDENGNGLPDETWYELAGSDYYFSTTVKGYEVSYTNPHEPVAADVPWSDNKGNSGYIYANDYHTQAYYPMADSFPGINNDNYTLTGTLIKEAVDTGDPLSLKSYRRAFGYADNQVRGSAPFGIPDNPYTREVENSGGDPFDIGWAIDKNGDYMELDEIDFVKVQNAVLAGAGPLGELSSEITGAIDIPPDNSITGIKDMVVIKDLPPVIDSSMYQLEVFVFHMGRLQENRQLNWECSVQGAYVDDNYILHVDRAGELTISASLADNPEITAVATTMVNVSQVSAELISRHDIISVYPNPSGDHFYIEGITNARISIFNKHGKPVNEISHYNGGRIDISGYPAGIYLIIIQESGRITSRKIVKM